MKLTDVFRCGDKVRGLEKTRADGAMLDAGLRYRLPERYGLITVGEKNLADRKLKYQETDFKNPPIQPGRRVFAQITLAFP